jgi:hypothetical protein
VRWQIVLQSCMALTSCVSSISLLDATHFIPRPCRRLMLHTLFHGPALCRPASFREGDCASATCVWKFAAGICYSASCINYSAACKRYSAACVWHTYLTLIYASCLTDECVRTARCLMHNAYRLSACAGSKICSDHAA